MRRTPAVKRGDTPARKNKPATATFSFKVPSGLVPGTKRWVPSFFITSTPSSRGLDYLQAQDTCRRRKQALCTESQWARACATDAAIKAFESWTGRVEDKGFIVRGGSQCEDRRAIRGAERISSRIGACCSRAIAINTHNTHMAFRITTASKMLKFEKALNTGNADIVGALFDGELDRGRKRYEMTQFYRGRFRAHPGLASYVDSCNVMLKNTGDATWTADCLLITRHANQIGSQTIRYVWGGEDKLIQKRQLRHVLRKLSPIDR